MSKLKILDDGLGVLLEGLESRGILDDTVIVLYGDHYPYGLTLEEVGEIEAEIMQSALLIVLISLYENRFCINSFSYN